MTIGLPDDARILQDDILALRDGEPGSFDALADRVHAFQLAHNPVVSAFADSGRFLPIAAFRETRVAGFDESEEETRFLSSGTGSGRRAVHPIRSIQFHDRVARHGFSRVFGPGPVVLVGHLPGYASESSLVHMVRHLVASTGHPASGVFHDDRERLGRAIRASTTEGVRFVMIGAAFGLLDLAESGPWTLPPKSVVVETGGMKTHRREMKRRELHRALADGFSIPTDRVWSEYGMCELTSQAWSTGGEWYKAPPWMRVDVVDPERPDVRMPDGRPGRIAVTDLANLHSAAFLLTEDSGTVRDGRFTVLGRLTGASLRGCNFLFEA